MPSSWCVVLFLVEIRLHLFANSLPLPSVSAIICQGRQRVPTSSRFDCFCRLALNVEAPVSLCMAVLWWDSNLGRGMFDGLFSKVGTCPLPCPRPGTPLRVPPAADMSGEGQYTTNPFQIFAQLTQLAWLALIRLFRGRCMSNASVNKPPVEPVPLYLIWKIRSVTFRYEIR